MDRRTSLRDPGRPSVGDLQSESGVWGRGWGGPPCACEIATAAGPPILRGGNGIEPVV